MTKIAADYFPFVQEEEQIEQLIATVRTQVKNYAKTHQLRAFVLGISGGVDSALCAALLKPVCCELNMALVGRSITIETNKADEIVRSVQVGQLFCSDFAYLDFTDIYLENRKIMPQLDETLLSKLRQGNMKARMRMLALYDLAQLHHGLVIATDNFTEYLTGFWTLHGDVGDYAPVQHLWKTEVYACAGYLLRECTPSEQAALQSCIDAMPVDGLGISASDCEQLGVSNYFEADKILARYLSGDDSLENHPIIRRYHASEYKRNNPLTISRKTLLSAINQA
ncbi:MAG: NAD(+) synthase [Bacteroidales bacterium]|jgi:NAD+ synthetase|nr:NAD(+) synthase [Bacteroidales bacterium]